LRAHRDVRGPFGLRRAEAGRVRADARRCWQASALQLLATAPSRAGMRA